MPDPALIWIDGAGLDRPPRRLGPEGRDRHDRLRVDAILERDVDLVGQPGIELTGLVVDRDLLVVLGGGDLGDVVAPEDRPVGLEPRRGIGLEVVARELDGLWLAVPGIATSSYGGQVQSFADRIERQEQAKGGGAVVTAANSAPSRVFLWEGAERDGGAPERPGLLRF